MKKNIYALVTSIVMLCVLLYPISTYGSEINMILMQGTLLSDYSESEEIEIMEEDILAMANSFEDDGFRAEVSDINFSDAYCVYVNADILENHPNTKDEFQKLLDDSDKVWNVPISVANKTVIVQVSRKLGLDDVNQLGLSQNEMEQMNSDAEKWQVVSSTMYENGETPTDQLVTALLNNNIDEERCDCIIVGGEDGIYSLLAIVLKDDEIISAISMDREISYTTSNTKTREVEDVTLEEGKLYSLDEFSNAASALNSDVSAVQDSTDGIYGGNIQNDYTVLYCIFLGVVCSGIMIGVFFFRKKKLR